MTRLKRSGVFWIGVAVALPACGGSEDGADGGTASDGADGATTDGTGGGSATSTGTGGDGGTSGDSGDDGSATGDGSGSDGTGGVPPLDECSQPGPDWIFCDSFEAGGTWDGSTTNPVLVSEPGPFGLADNHVAQLRVPPGSGGEGLIKYLDHHDVAYLRFYVMWEQGHDFTAPRHGPGGMHGGTTDCIGCSDNRPSDWFTSTLETVTDPPHTLQAYTYYPGMYMDCANPNGACWGDMFPCTAGPSYCTNPDHAPIGPQPEMEAGRWYCLEQMIDAGTPTAGPEGASGALDFWVDELEIGPWAELWFRSSDEIQISALWLYLYHHDQHSEEGLLLDNVVVSTTRIGCP
jgi:hypothetical protein